MSKKKIKSVKHKKQKKQKLEEEGILFGQLMKVMNTQVKEQERVIEVLKGYTEFMKGTVKSMTEQRDWLIQYRKTLNKVCL